MDKFLGRHKPPKQTQEETEYLNRATTKKEIQSVILNFAQTEVQAQLALRVNSTQTFQELISVFTNSYKNRRRGNTQKLI